jgi:TolA-binding protein
MNTILVTLLLVIGTAVTVAAVFGSFRVARNTSAVTSYRDAAQGWQAKAEAQKVEISDLQTELATANASIEHLEKRVQMLTDMVTSRTLIEALAVNLEGHHEVMMTKADEIIEVIKSLDAVVQRLPRGAT